jgi:hypothetical protein
MKPELRRIEAMLSQSNQKPQPGGSRAVPSQSNSISFTVAAEGSTAPLNPPQNPPLPLEQPIAQSTDTSIRLPNFFASKMQEASAPSEATAKAGNLGSPEPGDRPPIPNSPVSFKIAPPSTPLVAEVVRPFPVQDDTPATIDLPKFKLPHFSASRQVTNPEFAIGLLKEMQGIVAEWQKELQQIVLKIQDLYLEGAVIDGWLESKPFEPQFSGAAVLRHAEIDRLMEYVEELLKNSGVEANPKLPRTGYRLCGLDADGQLWSRPCPPEKLPQVSLAIARYQKLRQLLSQKRRLEDRLDEFAQSLIALHKTMKQID